MKFLLFYPGFLIAFCSCTHEQSRNTQNKSTYFNSFELGAYNKNVNVRISARFNECGEWGGHKEEIFLTADKSENFFAEYHVFPYNCDSLMHEISSKNVVPTISKKITLNEKNKLAILRFLHDMMDAIITQDLISHAANNFTIANSDSSLFLSLSTDKASDIANYKSLVETLF